MNPTDRYRELLDCVQRQLGFLDAWDRRILDYWYVCGRQRTRNAEEVDRDFTASDWAAHVAILWKDFLFRYDRLWTDFLRYNLSDEEIDVLIEMGLIIREVAQLTASTPAAKISEDDLVRGGIIPLLDIFYQWENLRRLQAYLFTNAGFITREELEKKRDELTGAINQCLDS